jgi:hypothetical protein
VGYGRIDLMKTLYKNIQTGAKAIAKRKELEARHGMHLTCYTTGAGTHFRPYVHVDTIDFCGDGAKVKAVEDILPIDSMGISFTAISDKTGIKILDVLSIAKLLLNKRNITGDVSRDGKIIGMHKTKDGKF